jgi:hypothetical protein
MITSQIRQAAVGTLRPHHANARAPSKKQLVKIAPSIRQSASQFGSSSILAGTSDLLPRTLCRVHINLL